jgi:hypothetical protein
MHSEAQLNPETVERLEQHSGLRLSTHDLKMARDSAGQATDPRAATLLHYAVLSTKSMGNLPHSI